MCVYIYTFKVLYNLYYRTVIQQQVIIKTDFGCRLNNGLIWTMKLVFYIEPAGDRSGDLRDGDTMKTCEQTFDHRGCHIYNNHIYDEETETFLDKILHFLNEFDT